MLEFFDMFMHDAEFFGAAVISAVLLVIAGGLVLAVLKE